MKRRFAIAALLGLPLAARAQRATKPAFKGMELYSWAEGAEWVYALVLGTNRNKHWAELCSSGVGYSSLKDKLSALAAGENVSWMLDCQGAPPKKLALPPPNTREELQQLCGRLEVHLFIPK